MTTDRYDIPVRTQTWWDLSPDTTEEAVERRNSMDEAITDDTRWRQRRLEVEQQEQR